MSEEQIIMQCSPTLAGIKAASLFSLRISSREDLLFFLRKLNRNLTGKGVAFIPLKIRPDSALIFAFRSSLLQRLLSNEEARALLLSLGYDPDNICSCIKTLIRRIGSTNFPHEIGIFLGYPAEDVIGFIKNKGKGYRSCGMWKVYGEPDEREKLFEKYRSCTARYMDEFLHGNTVERLTVAV